MMKWLSASFLSLLFLSQSPEPARACMNEVQISTSEARKLLLKAEKALAAGQNEQVADMLEKFVVKDEALMRRRDRVFAVAVIRTGGLGVGILLLKELLKAKPDDPYLKTRLAEGLSYYKDDENEQKRARALLEELDRADLIPDAEGDLVLARLRAAADDRAGSERALARCQKRSSDPARCTLPK
jgi:predicted Zn-dependent protease